MAVQRRQRSDPTVVGPARVDARTKRLTRRLHAGDIAVINHEDLDRLAAEELVEAQPGAVINAARSISGRYPNVGPLLVAAAGIPLIDDVGPEGRALVREGQVLRATAARCGAATTSSPRAPPRRCSHSRSNSTPPRARS